MSRLRQLRVQSLQNLKPGESFVLPHEEAKHARVLRLKDGAEVEITDGEGCKVRATLSISGAGIMAKIISGSAAAPAPDVHKPGQLRLQLAVAWPKGKRAAFMVEKCCELGVERIQPVRYARGVVSKDQASAGLARLRRIAAEAAKQCGRGALPEITVEKELGAVLAEDAPRAVVMALNPSGQQWLPEALAEARAALQERPLLLFVGPEGGFSPEELAAFKQARVPLVRMARTVLRVETAAMAACAIAGATDKF